MFQEIYAQASNSISGEDWVYYGFSPPANYTPTSIEWGAAGTIVYLKRNGTTLMVVGYNDSTHVAVYDITGGRSDLFASFTVDRLGNYSLQIPLDIFFKIVSDKPIAALLYGGLMYDLSGSRLYYPSTDGGYAGKEFIFYSVPSSHFIYGIEEGTATLYDQRGSVLKTLKVSANNTYNIPVVSDRVYRITSTGRILVGTTASGFTITPSPFGGQIGTLFPSPSFSLVIVAQESSARVSLRELGTGVKLAEKDLSPRQAWFVNASMVPSWGGKSFLVESTEDVLCYEGTTSVPTGYTDGIEWISNGISFLCIKPNKPTTLFVISRAIAFSPDGCAAVRVAGLTLNISRGFYRELPPGLITVTSNSTLIVQVVSEVATLNIGTPANPFYVGITDLRNFGVYLMSSKTISIAYPPPKPSGRGLDYIFIGGIVVAVVIAVAVVIRRIKKS
jgi:hypothetical protein